MLKLKTKTAVLGALAGVLALAAAHAIEIPLEGDGKSMSIAYVNMRKIFEAFPETEKARLEINTLIELKKDEISKKREEIAKLRAETEFLRKQMSAVLPSTSPRTGVPEEGEEPAADVPAEPRNSTGLTLPEGSPLGFIFSPPLASTAPVEGETAAEPARAEPEVRYSTAGPQILPGIPSPEPDLKDKEKLLVQKETDLEVFIGAAEEELKRMEEGKTLTLLARIYKSLEEVAAKNGYTVIVDKENILYGETAVDITQEVLWRLSLKKSKD